MPSPPPEDPRFFLVDETTFKNFNRQYLEKKLRKHQPDIPLIEPSREGRDGFGAIQAKWLLKPAFIHELIHPEELHEKTTK